ncbi:MAG: AAA family ATPase [Nanobdellota archaeon]
MPRTKRKTARSYSKSKNTRKKGTRKTTKKKTTNTKRGPGRPPKKTTRKKATRSTTQKKRGPGRPPKKTTRKKATKKKTTKQNTNNNITTLLKKVNQIEKRNKALSQQLKKTQQERETVLPNPTIQKEKETIVNERQEPHSQAEEKQEEKTPTIEEPDPENTYQTTEQKGIISINNCKRYSAKLKRMLQEISKVFIGQEQITEQVTISLMCDSHILMEGVPGLAKTLLVETMQKTISGTTFKRIQFLPDLLPADVIGGQIYNPKTSKFTTYKGPIFANFVLADEINRAPPKTHAAVMEAMQEKKINIENDEFILQPPFLVLATQNPLENKGTYSLPEAVLDRFMLKVFLDYPARKDELKIITENATTKSKLGKTVHQAITKEELLEIQKEVKTVYISQKIRTYILNIVEATRGKNKNIEGIRYIKYGAGVRASIYLGVAAKAKAMLEGRNYVLPDDIKFVAPSVLRHRVSMNYKGKAHNISPDKIVEEVLQKVDAV